jgi:NTE family protein
MSLNKLLSSIRRPSSTRGGDPPGLRLFASRKRISLALQGGGAHGAFTWGVLHEILSDGRIAIDGISGASAGAVNAIMLADGLAAGGPEEAQRRLAEFWRGVSFDGNLPDLQRAVVKRLFTLAPGRRSPAGWIGMSGFLSPTNLTKPIHSTSTRSRT